MHKKCTKSAKNSSDTIQSARKRLKKNLFGAQNLYVKTSFSLSRDISCQPTEAPAKAPGNGTAPRTVPCQKPRCHPKAFRRLGKGFSEASIITF